jgi:hypothetical protein
MTGRWTFPRELKWWSAALVIAGAWTWLTAASPKALAPDASLGDIPDVVMLDQLSKTENLYEPVPFDHKAHAGMAQIAGKCQTCHHRTPENGATRAGAGAGATRVAGERGQEQAAKHPACRTCHEPHRTDLRQPGLKGAYHRQCLNCHREWALANNCTVCHKPRSKDVNVVAKVATPDDIMGRMHPPVPEPETRQFVAAQTPADGANVLFRHKEHTQRYGVTCATCHRDDACSRCHVGSNAPRPVQAPKVPLLDADWNVVHANCSGCHRRQETRCVECHFKSDSSAPEPFDHGSTGQLLDADHANLRCSQCHANWLEKSAPTCGTAGCHATAKPITFPLSRPGPVARRQKVEPPVKQLPAPVKRTSTDTGVEGVASRRS